MIAGPMSTYASSCPVRTRVTEYVAEPMSNTAPPTDDTSMSSSSTLARTTAGRPRKPSAQNRLSRSVRPVGRNGMSAPEARVMLKPASFSATKRSPLLISCTTPATTSPIVGVGDAGTAATLTQAISKPAAAGRVPSTGSTMRMSSGSVAPWKPPSSE